MDPQTLPASMANDPPPPAEPLDVPDLMNDPAFDPNTQNPDRAQDEPDSCRICRGEGSPEEPLFYPCKCSGSIKFVHQECLMEWLSHSQKKYCELCKTSFRFTKLYSPHMPKKLPTRVFIQKAIMHVVSHVFVWLRGLLVGSVWLLGLPWLMRYSWRIMFWFGDAGWARDNGMDLVAGLQGPPSNDAASVPLDIVSNHTMPSIPSFLNMTSQTLNVTRGEPLLFKLVKALGRSMYEPLRRSEILTEASSNLTVEPLLLRMAQQKQSSVLSEVDFLKHLTPSPTFNRLIIDILEGQIITVSVVVACILVFLIREWVLQQQPVADIAIGDADNALAQAGGGAQEQAQVDIDEHPVLRGADDEFEIPDPADEVEASASRADAEEAAPIHPTAEDAPASTVQEIKAIIDKTDNLLNDCSPEVRQVLLDRYPFLNNLENLKERAEHLDRDTTSLPSRSPALTEERTGQEVIDTPLHELLASAAKDVETSLRPQDSHAESSGTQRSILEDDHNQSELKSGPRASRFAGRLSSEASVDGSDETVKERPQMPIRERSFLATDIARSMEEQSVEEEENPAHVPREGFNTLFEDEQGSQGSSGSWQQVSAPEQDTITHTSGGNGRVQDSPEAGENKGKDQAVSSSDVPPTLHRVNIFDESKALDSNVTDDHVGPSGVRDDLSWISTAGSDPSHTRGETDDPSRTEGPNDQQVAPSFDVDAEGSSGAQGAEGSSDITVLNPEQEEVESRTFVERVMNWFWGDIPAPERHHIVEGLLVEIEDGDDEHVVHDLANEAPFVPFAQAQPLAGQPQNVAGAEPAINPDDAVLAPPVNLDPNDPDAIDDAEDLEGILELIGMQGPVLGLFQNALFSSVLILISVVTCVWLPYMYGKLVLLSLSVPELLIRVPLQMGTIIADLLIDSCLTVGGYLTFWVANFWRFGMSLFFIDVKARWLYQVIALPAHRIGYAALERLVGGVATTKELEAKDFLYLSMICHAGLHSLEESFFTGGRLLSDQVAAVSHGIYTMTFSGLWELILGLPSALVETELAQFQSIKQALVTLWNTGLLSISIGEPIITPSDPMLAYWNAKDRALAVIAGYGAVAFCSACYLKIAPITSSPKYRHNEQYIIELCQQAGGVLKVILIISIEMIAFPLFCGFLLDFALLPLFESATFSSRVSFTLFSPWTAGFVHWFVGTCYMFHFALFVSMCRKIMRTGVLYFIRDPDDPTFHPVRDVLERNVITQLRKIAFSAIVYGALIVVCLGGVVWTMWFASTNVLPIHWTSSESALEFPLDILFYNFLTPVVVRFARPSDGLHTMYKWWFRKCARILRLSDFLFKDQHRDEQGHHVHRTWKSWLTRQTGDVEEAVDTEPEDKQVEVYFKRDGRHVKAPASDQVRIPKGSPVFVDVDEVVDDTTDGQAPQMNGTNPTMTAIVYIPPWFRVRIALFVVAVWFFAASTGIMVTIVPLLVGRKILSTAIPNANNVNDIYAFSLGIYVLGGILWTVLRYRPILTFLRSTFWPSSETRAQAASKILSSTKQVLSVVYVYSALGLGLPILFAVLLELYILMPIHVFFGPEDSHVIHVIQDWTLGILYVRIGTRILTWDRQSRTARAVQAVVRKGLLKPAAGLATRVFILPSLFAFGVLLGVPYAVSMALNGTIFRFADEEKQIQIIRLSYPIAMAVVLSIWIFIITSKATERWRSRIRDEVYLIGERLHNFGERRPGPTTRQSEGEKTVTFRNGQLVVE